MISKSIYVHILMCRFTDGGRGGPAASPAFRVQVELGDSCDRAVRACQAGVRVPGPGLPGGAEWTPATRRGSSGVQVQVQASLRLPV